MTATANPFDSGLPIDPEYKDLELNLTQQFELDKMRRMIDSCEDKVKLKDLTHTLLRAWFVQKAAVAFVMKQKLTEFDPIIKTSTNEQQQSRA
jgi:hypothetical protein